ncbi:ABC transporter ATP-binding protein [Pleomorphovibrio marinus]|uniref:ABC transporter ATP-binding protein n=1 Tax=Pleomorphovibrio marinus TaxID=2164132 RepID=UPI000E0CBC2B|nr:ABC transporter ATP-binding protein [Pleomorphovibrio marinus]
MHTYFRLLSFAKPIEKYAIPYVLFTLLAVLFNTLNLALLAPLLNTLFNEGGGEVVAPEKSLDIMGHFNYYTNYMHQEFGPYEALKVVCLVIVLSVVFSNLFRYLSQRVMENLRIHTLLNLRKRVFDNVMDLQVEYFNNQRKGNIISKISSDVQVVQFSVTSTLQVLFKEPLQLMAYLFILFAISYKLTLFAMLVIPISGFAISRIVKRLRAQASEAQERYGMMISLLDEALSGIKIIKAFNATERVKDRFNQENKEYSALGRKMAYRQQLASPVSETLGVMMVALIVLYGGSLVMQNQSELSAAEFITYIAIFSQIMRPAKALTESFSTIHSGIAAGDRVLKLIDEKPTITDNSDSVELKNFEEGITFKKVRFTYGDKDVLKDISFVVPKGKTIALVGPSGGGKSTLMDLIPRFLEINEGRLLFDGHDIKKIRMDSLRSHIGIVNQESILFNESIRNNIAFGNPDASMGDVEKAAKIANAHDFIVKTPKGYDTNMGDRGLKFSGGQKQRICIARAILKNPAILLLDEATSALDTESEKLVQDALNRLMKNRTTLVIAHRLSTIQSADWIIVLDDGKVVEEGTHQSLLLNEGVYRKLVEMQEFTTA